MEGLVSTNSVSFILVFLEGVLSFFSPCVLPLIPVYIGYLAGSGKKVNDDGTIVYERKKVFFYTMFFILGISFAFFILGMSFTALGTFFKSNQLLFTRIGGILIILLGLFQLGIFDFAFLQKERRININTMNKKMTPVMALVMGFTFSFAWTPCIGPALSSVLIMASGATTTLTGNMLVLVYALGFLLPFLLLGLFTTQVLNFLKSKQKFLKYTIKAGGIILIIMGIMIFTGWMNGISSYLNQFNTNQKDTTVTVTPTVATDSSDTDVSDSADNNVTGTDTTDVDAAGTDTQDNTTEDTTEEKKVIPAFDFTLTDQYGNEHTLSDYKGKVVFLNFWATWCGPCKEELPDIEDLYQEYNLNEDEVVFLGITNPKSDAYPYNNDETIENITKFIDENGYTFPTMFDETGEILENYYISAFPTTFMIDKEGNIFGYVPGMMTRAIMESVIEQTLNATE